VTAPAPVRGGGDGWLAWRGRGIGGSDIPGILGISPWASPLSVWRAKVTGGGSAGTGGTYEALRWGKLLEDAILAESGRRLGVVAHDYQLCLTHDDHDWARCTLDALYSEAGPPAPPQGVIEVKTTGEHRWDTLPGHVEAQVQWQLEVADLPDGWVACLHAGQRLSLWHVERDRDVGWGLLDVAGRFWTRYVQAGVPPPLDGHPATTAALAARYHAEPGQVADLAKQANDIAWLRSLHARQAALETEIEQLSNRVRAALGTATEGKIDGRTVVTWRAHSRRAIDVERLREEQPAIAEQYTTTSEVRPLRLVPPRRKERTTDG
jgi:putative phage-type endonuclease